MNSERMADQQPEMTETAEEVEAKKQFWRGWAEQAKKEAPARKKFMEDTMAAFLEKYPEYNPD